MTLIEIVAIVTALSAVIGLAVTMIKLGNFAGVMETTMNNQNRVIDELKNEVKGLTKVMTEQAVQKNEISALREDTIDLRRQIRDLQHGEGFVLPLETALRQRLVNP